MTEAKVAYKVIIYYKDGTKFQALATEKDVEFMIENDIFSKFTYSRLPKKGYYTRKLTSTNYSITLKTELRHEWIIDMMNIASWGYYPVFPLEENNEN